MIILSIYGKYGRFLQENEGFYGNKRKKRKKHLHFAGI